MRPEFTSAPVVVAGFPAVVNLYLENEDIHPRDCFDPELEDLVADICQRADNGDPWAWFCARVEVTVNVGGQIIRGVDTLGGCSYDGPSDFLRGDDYFGDMLQNAVDDAEAQIESLRRALAA